MNYLDSYQIIPPIFIYADENWDLWNPSYETAFYSDVIANRELDEVALWGGI